MAFPLRTAADRRHSASPAVRGPGSLALVLVLTLAGALAFRDKLALDALAPVVATVLFTLAAISAGVALLLGHGRLRGGLLDIAGTLTFAGVALSLLIEPEQMVRLTTVSEQND